jgi:heme-degrading monooxygenase HmoA
MRIWATHAEHVEAKKNGRKRFFSEYRVQICSVQRDSAFPLADRLRPV